MNFKAFSIGLSARARVTKPIRRQEYSFISSVDQLNHVSIDLVRQQMCTTHCCHLSNYTTHRSTIGSTLQYLKRTKRMYRSRSHMYRKRHVLKWIFLCAEVYLPRNSLL